MDTQAYPKLDPKLKETYDRIMGMKTGSKPHVPAVTEHVEEVTLDAKPLSPETDKPASESPTHASSHLTHIAYNSSSGTKKPEEKKLEEKKPEEKKTEPKDEKHEDNSQLVPIILGISGVIFFIFYAIFWIRFFSM